MQILLSADESSEYLNEKEAGERRSDRLLDKLAAAHREIDLQQNLICRIRVAIHAEHGCHHLGTRNNCAGCALEARNFEQRDDICDLSRKYKE